MSEDQTNGPQMSAAKDIGCHSASLGTKRSKMPLTEPFVVEAKEVHTHSFILLHGLGSNGERFGGEFLSTAITSDGSMLQSLLPHARFIFPTAQRRRSSAFSRSVLTQWFDLASLSDPSIRQDVQYQGLAESGKLIRELIDGETERVPPVNILLGGLSQGCAMSLSVLLSLEFSLGGFIGMSGWLPFQKDLAKLIVEETTRDNEDEPFNQPAEDPVVVVAAFLRDVLSIDVDTDPERTALRTPIFIGHGDADLKIPPHLGNDAAEVLASTGLDVTWMSYVDQGHWYKVPDEIDDIVGFWRKKTNFLL
jgi:predicted esterase